MKILLTVVIYLKLQTTRCNYIINSNPVEPPAVCPCDYKYDPVCGSDNITYINSCILKCQNDANCNNGFQAVYEVSKGECSSCICQNINLPVCTLDGEIYPNECELACENIKRIKNKISIIYLAYRAACRGPPCDCTNIAAPVCGSDNVLYRSKCVLECASLGAQSDCLPEIEFQNNGACLDGCLCPITKDPVCGSDGKIYNNICELECQNRKLKCSISPPVTVANEDYCKKCVCEEPYDPVCGSDGKTYPNCCELNCEAERQNNCNLKVINEGNCPKCYCTDEWDPVCGTNGQTYENECKLRCANEGVTDPYDIICINNYGACSPAECSCSQCSGEYKPVCDNTAQTYWNLCWLNCYSDCCKNKEQSPIYLTKEEACCV